MYRIEFTLLAEKQFSKLEKETQERILRTLERIRVRPHSFVKKLSGLPYSRLRVGDYRLVLKIQDDILIILVIEIGHRKNIYD